ncbi:hypothetical protein FQN51_000290 [Onygenales sp. PD_10]|nr:hypothetical protein FQN51_000290 [Onygenales sp. PD_10]
MGTISIAASPAVAERGELIGIENPFVNRRQQSEHHNLPNRPGILPSLDPKCRDDFPVGLTPSQIEFSAARYMFDEEHEQLPRKDGDTNFYILGVLSGHNTVLASLPAGSQGTATAATVANNLRRSFPDIKFKLLVGIGGGVPSEEDDIRLGDVVVSEPKGTLGGVVEYDLGKQTTAGFQRKGFLCPIPSEWRSIVTNMKSNHRTKPNRVTEFRLEMLGKYPMLTEYERPSESDLLFPATYKHVAEAASCAHCNKAAAITRKKREGDHPKIFYGLIASGNSVVKDAEKRDRLAHDAGGAICFEMEAAGLMNDFQCIVIRGIADYCDSHKNGEWHGYAAAAAAGLAKEILLLESPAPFAKAAEFLLAPFAKEDKNLREKKISILRKLYTCNYQDAKNRNRLRVEGTCGWFTGHPRFRHWLESECSALLWVSADPGCGKSVLARYLIDELLSTPESKTVCYFFFKDDFDDQKSLPGAICCILRQLFDQKPELLSRSVVDVFKKDGQRLLKSFDGLWRMFINTISQESVGEIICVVDALDECSGEGQRQLAEILCYLYNGRAKRCRLKFLLTSRPYDSIQRSFQLLENALPTIHLRGENEDEVQQISVEINNVIRHEVMLLSDRRQLFQDEQELVLKGLSSVPNRTYLWVYLVLHALDEIVPINPRNIRMLVRELPQSVNEAYNQILCRSRNREEARKALHMIVAATRPLSLEEMAMAMALIQCDQRAAPHEIEVEPESRFRNTIREICGLFVTIVDSKIYLLHQSAREFLIYNQDAEMLYQSLEWKGSLRPIHSDLILAAACTYYFLYILPGTPLFNSMTLRIDPPVDCPFLVYSVDNWPLHVRRACIEKDSILFPSVMKLLHGPARADDRWFTVLDIYNNGLSDSSPLTRASFFGFAIAAETLLQDNTIDVNKQSSEGSSALWLAAMEGHQEIVKLLLKAPMVNLNIQDTYYGQTPLGVASDHGRAEVVKLLLDTGELNVDAIDGSGDTPLLQAISSGHEEIVKILLDTGKADPNTRGTNFRGIMHIPLIKACQNGREAIVEMLLDTGKVNPGVFQTPRRETPLMYASSIGHTGIVKMLLDTGRARLAFQDCDGQTAFSHAVYNDHPRVVKLLLKACKPEDINLQDNLGQTPLDMAVLMRRERIAKILQKAGGVRKCKASPYLVMNHPSLRKTNKSVRADTSLLKP